MFSWLLRRKIDSFERSFDYDMSYAREILAESPRALRTWNRATELVSWREGVPRDVWYAARLAALLEQDCGPCAQLLVTMAERSGIDSRMLSAVIERRYDALDEGLAVSARFASAVVRGETEANGHRERLVELYGRRALLALAFGITASCLYPTLKRALGYDKECRRVVVAGRAVTAGRRAPRLALGSASSA
jgi:hypothetical protein